MVTSDWSVILSGFAVTAILRCHFLLPACTAIESYGADTQHEFMTLSPDVWAGAKHLRAFSANTPETSCPEDFDVPIGYCHQADAAPQYSPIPGSANAFIQKPRNANLLYNGHQ